METNAGGGFKKAMGRLFSGDSIFMNEYTPEGGPGMIAFASSFPGCILPFDLKDEAIIVQKRGFLAMEKGLDLSIYFQKKLGKGLFGGEGFIMQRVSGTGMVFVEIDGHCKEYTLAAGESIVVDTGHLAAMSESCTMDIQPIQGAKNVLFGGEGLFNTVITGPGKVYLQGMPISQLAQSLSPFLTTESGGGINIKLGDN
jgi:uncharacterized protein (TIGR00266 family)